MSGRNRGPRGGPGGAFGGFSERGRGDRQGGGGGRGRGEYGDRGRGRGDGGRGRGGGGRGDGSRGGGGGGRGRGGNSGPPPFFNPGPLVKDDSIQKTGDDLVTKMKQLTVTVGESTLPRRPGYGTVGKQTWVRANYFPVTIPKSTLLVYDVKLEPEVKNRRKKKRLYEILEQHDDFRSYARHTATDYGKTIVSMKPLNPNASTSAGDRQADKVEVTVTYTDSEQPPPPTTEGRPPQTYKFIIERVAETQPSDLQRYVDGGFPDYNSAVAIQALNIILAKFPIRSDNMVAVGRNKFFVLDNEPAHVSELGSGLEARKGFYSSIRPSVGRVLCNLNVCTTAFYKSKNLAEVMKDYLGNKYSHLQDIPLERILRLRTFLRHVRVETRYMKNQRNNTKILRKTIKGVNTKAPRQVEFELKHPLTGAVSKMNVLQYFTQTYGIGQLRFPNLPAVNIGAGEHNAWVPPELCHIIPGQPFVGKLQDDQTGKMILFACKSPKENADTIVGTGLPRLGHTGNNRDLEPFGVKVATNMVSVPARILGAPRIKYTSDMEPTGATWNLYMKKFNQGASMPKGTWSILAIQEYPNQVPAEEARRHASKFKDVCLQSGMNVGDPMLAFPGGSNPTLVVLPNRRNSQAVEDTLRPCFQIFMKHNVKMLLVILTNQDKAVYSSVKYCGDTKAGIGTVCTTWKKLIGFKSDGQQAQYFANVALKFNMKLGGRNHVFTSPPNQLKAKTMIVGCDVTHPSPSSQTGSPSIAGVVASIDSSYAQYPASLALQESRKEMITDLKGMMIQRLKLWYSKNRSYPESIIVYRDGVSEGQFQIVLDAELPQIKKACKEVGAGPTYNPKITIIIVGKRHHTRFYPVSESQNADSSGNTVPGTVVDRGVTSVYDFDFFLQAHAGIKGTARPAHYYVIYDQNKFTADALQSITHNLCYLFGRATKAVSVCPPAYYADLVCERGRCYIHSLLNFSDDRSDSSKAGGTPEEIAATTMRNARATWSHGVHPALRDTMFYL